MERSPLPAEREAGRDPFFHIKGGQGEIPSSSCIGDREKFPLSVGGEEGMDILLFLLKRRQGVISVLPSEGEVGRDPLLFLQ